MARKQIMVGKVPVGGGAPVTVQSMTNTRTEDIEATAEQALRVMRVVDLMFQADAEGGAQKCYI